MSMFNQAKMPCPVCGTPKTFDLVASVNADRRPDLRSAILDGSFQREQCDSCGSTFRTAPLMTYLDMGRHQWILAQPGSDAPRWKELAAKARSVFTVAYGPDAAPEAQEMGREMRARVVFGWGALSEKLLCGEHGLDDVNLELLKMAVLREVPDPPLDDQNELRLVEVEGDELVLGWISVEDEHSSGVVRVPRELYDQIAADTGDWQPLRDELSADPFVDYQRLVLADPAPEGEAEAGEDLQLTAADEDESGEPDEDEKPAARKSKAAPAKKTHAKKSAPKGKAAPAKRKPRR